jgi:hypothetical protein
MLSSFFKLFHEFGSSFWSIVVFRLNVVNPWFITREDVKVESIGAAVVVIEEVGENLGLRIR